ncbi:MAG: DUF1573 domain-containing protein [Bacteroidaceae bacterium]|nr:DUF1573 domain-containing protein [Bacteroidaceae bacterium]
MKRIMSILSWTLVLAFTDIESLLAQPRMVADTPQQKVGEIVWQNPKNVVFTIRNKGNQPLRISEVHPSCGCVKVDFPETVAAGGTGTITATYNAAMLGTFYRELAVYTNEQDEPYYLGFQGRVVESALDYDGDFPIDLGNVRLSTNYVEFDDVNKGDRPVVELQVANLEHGTYTPQLMHLPNYLTAEYVPDIIQQGRVGKIRLTLNSDKLFLDGLNQTSVYLARYMGDKVSDENEIVVSAVLLPAFRNLTAERLESAPHIVLMDGNEMIEDEITMTIPPKKKSITKVINVTNIGEETLTVSAVQVFNRAMTVNLGDRNIPPHGTTKLKITLDAKELKRAKSGPRLLLISNDPRHAKTVLNINVEE